MIVSVHIPKTAGTSFRYDLAEAFGARLLPDYGDWPELQTPEATAHNDRRRAAMILDAGSIEARYDVIHGHFAAGKYTGVFPVTAFVTFVRDPYQHAVSTYEHAVRSPEIAHPGLGLVRSARMTLLDFIEAFPNHQSLYLRGLRLDDCAMVGVTERYEQSIALFEAIFGVAIPRGRQWRNVNPTKPSAEYEITPDVRRAVERHRPEDLALYRIAHEGFTKLCLAHELQ